MEERIDPIILGHNQFFGVDHLSSEKGASREMYFADINNVLKLIRFSMDQKVSSLMMSTHPRAKTICDRLRDDPHFKDHLHLYPVLPYIAKYVREANEKGITNVIIDSLAGASIAQRIALAIKGSRSVVAKDIYSMLEVIIDMELLIFKGLNIRAIFLHQALTDLALGLDLKDIFKFYISYIQERYNVLPAFCTYNLPLLVRKFSTYGIEDPVIMSPFNKIGFQMNPTIEENERCLQDHRVRIVAMGTLASGYLSPKEAYEYLFSFPNIESVVVGVSTKPHVIETFNIIKSHL